MAAATIRFYLDENLPVEIAEQTGEEVILMKDSAGHVIGFEKLNFMVEESQDWCVRVN